MSFPKEKKFLKFFLIAFFICISGFWATYSIAGLEPLTDEISPPLPDTDGDGINDNFEDLVGMDKTNPSDANGDIDGDGLTNLQEFLQATDLLVIDTDADGNKDRTVDYFGGNLTNIVCR